MVGTRQAQTETVGIDTKEEVSSWNPPQADKA
jgi:hypothetical protein